MSNHPISQQLRDAAAGIENEVKRNNALALLARMEEVIEGIGDKPISWHPSMLKLVQSMSKLDKLPDGAKAGKFVLEQEVCDEVRAYPLRIWTTRTYWPEDLENDRKICESPDGKTGWKYGDCNKCDFGKWDEEASRIPCTKALQFMMVKEDFSNVFIANFQKSGYRNGMDFEKLAKSTKTLLHRHQYIIEAQKNPKNKQVFNIAAGFVPASEYKLTTDEEKFLAELFSHFGEARRMQLEAYEAGIRRRAENQGQRQESDRTVVGEHDEDRIQVIPATNVDDSRDEEDGSVNYEV